MVTEYDDEEEMLAPEEELPEEELPEEPPMEDEEPEEEEVEEPVEEVEEEPEYWALFASEDLADKLVEKRKCFLDYFQQTELFEKIQRSFLFFHGQFYNPELSGGAIKLSGEEADQRRVASNEYRGNLSLLATYVVGQKPAWDTVAEISDYDVLEATKLGNTILDSYMLDPVSHVESCLTQSVTDGLVMSAGFVWNPWDEALGEELDADENMNTLQYKGDFRFRNPSVLDVAYDLNVRDFKDSNWVLVRSKENKYDLIAQRPELKELLLASDAEDEEKYRETDELTLLRLQRPDRDESDHVWVYYFYHKLTPAVPQGRMVRFVTNEIVLEDRPLTERHIPVHRIVPSQYLLTCFGYSHAFDMQPLQEGLNALMSILLTNANALGMNKIWLKYGEPVNQAELEPGVSVLQSETPPQSLNFLQDAPSLFKGVELYTLKLEGQSGVNAASKGNPDYNLQSGSAIAMVDSRTLQAASELIQNYRRLLCDVGTSILKTLQYRASEERMMSLVGVNGSRFIKAFKGEMLDGISHVSVQSSNPITDTLQGRTQLAQFLATTGLIKTPEELVTVIKTGNIDRLTEHSESQVRNTQWENDAMLRGEQVPMLLIDNHRYHIVKHALLFDDPQMRMDQNKGKNIMAHIMQHVQALNDPKGLVQGLQQLLGYAMPAPMGGPPGGGAPPGGPPRAQQVGTNPAPDTKGMPGPVKNQVNEARMNAGMPPDSR